MMGRDTGAGSRPAGPPAGVTTIEVEVAYALPEKQQIVALRVPVGTTAGEAIDLSGIRVAFPEIQPQPVVGIFSRKVGLDCVLCAGDRVEIYRPLIADPKEIRRARAERDRRSGD